MKKGKCNLCNKKTENIEDSVCKECFNEQNRVGLGFVLFMIVMLLGVIILAIKEGI